MNPAAVIFVLCCVAVAAAAVLAFEVAVFRIACGLCRVPRPGPVRTVGLVLALLAVLTVVDAVASAVLYEAYTAAGYPLWEAGLVDFLLSLPIHMVICSTLHAQFLRVPFGQGLAVWLVERLIKFALVAAVVAVVVVWLLLRAKG